MKSQQPPARAGAKSSGEIRKIRKSRLAPLGAMAPSDIRKGFSVLWSISLRGLPMNFFFRKKDEP